MRSISVLVFVGFLAAATVMRADEPAKDAAAPIHVTINAAKAGPPINPFIYGQFVEHLGRCIYGGIWAEMLEDRKFYYPITEKYAPYGDLKDTRFPVVVASPWKAIGPAGSVTMETDKPLSGEHSVKITHGGGIEQNDLGLVAGQEYDGHVRVRSPNDSTRLTATLSWGENANEVQRLRLLPQSDDYVEQRFSFRPKKSTDHGQLRIEVAGGTCMIGAVSLMPTDNVRGFRRDTLELLKQLNAPIYRWPGGNFVSGYDWRDGLGSRDRRPTRKNPAWTGIDSNDMGIDEFLDLCHEIHTEPMIAVNTGFGDDYSAAQEVEYANSGKDTVGKQWRVENGHIDPYGVRYWCVGNEMFGHWQLGHMELGQYVLKHMRFVHAMRKVDPKIVLVGSGDLGTKATLQGNGKRRDVNWSEGLLSECGDGMDFISEHFYKGKTPWGDQPPKEMPKYVALLKDEIRHKATAHRDLQKKLGRTPDHYIPIAMDEWNYWHRGYIYGELGCEYSLADALGVAAGLHEYFRNTDIIHMANYAQTVNVIGCIKTTKTAAFFDTTALPLLLYRREFGTVPLAVSGNQSDRGLDIAAAKSADGSAVTIGVVNPQAKSQTIDVKLEGIKPGSTAKAWRVTGPSPTAHNTAEKKDVAITEDKSVPFDGKLTVPAYSANVYRVPIE
jgi:alpha-N-arabinofuranosidase